MLKPLTVGTPTLATALCSVCPSERTELTATLRAGFGPRLLTVTVYVNGEPTTAGVGAACTVVSKSAGGSFGTSWLLLTKTIELLVRNARPFVPHRMKLPGEVTADGRFSRLINVSVVGS